MALIDDIVNTHPLDIADNGFQEQPLDNTDSAVHSQSDQMDANAALDSQGHYHPETSTDIDGQPDHSQPNSGIEDHPSDHFQQPIWVDEHSVHGFAGHSDIVHQFDDANHNMIPDHLEVDMNGNGIPDHLEVQDYNHNMVPDQYETVDTDHNGIPDQYDADLNHDGLPDHHIL